jgi:hypothetical protein
MEQFRSLSSRTSQTLPMPGDKPQVCYCWEGLVRLAMLELPQMGRLYVRDKPGRMANSRR